MAQALGRRRKRAGLLAARRQELRPHYSFRGHGRGRLNVTVVLRSAAKPTSSTYIRLYSPLARPAFGRRIGLDIVDEKAIWISPRSSVCIVQRTAFSTKKAARAFLAEARRRGCLVIVDSDDAFSELDPQHPQYELQIKRAAILDGVMREADEVWLSTEELLSAHPGPTSRVVRNTLDVALWNPDADRRPPPDDAPLRILYMGTTTHDGDFALIAPVLDRLHAAHPGELEVVMVGVGRGLPEKPWATVLKPPSGAYPQFVPWLVGEGPFDIGISPLVDSTFNRAKSDIKCLDYLALGARPVVSDVVPYRVAELDDLVDRVGNEPDEWYAALEDLLERRVDLRRDADGRRAAGTAYVVESRAADITAAHLRQRIDALRSDARDSP
ncbi:MAG: hypothetical protein ABWX74_09850 [Aeromicrobium sp.]